MSSKDRAVENEWRAQADDGGCADWGIAWAFDPAPEVPEPLTRRHALVVVIIAAAVISLIMIAIFNRDITSWPSL